MRKRWILGVVAILAIFLVGCGGGDDVYVAAGPGLVGLDDSSDATAPLLAVTYTTPSSDLPVTVKILSDHLSAGDIAKDPVLISYFPTQAPPEVWFGIDSLDAILPEYRAFLTFPLDGITGQPFIPSDAFIESAYVEVFVNFLDFASAVPTFLDLVQYPPAYDGQDGLGSVNPADDFEQPPLARRSGFDFIVSDAGRFVRIEATSLMDAAQILGLFDFQVRFSRNMSVPPLSPSPSSRSSAGVGRTVVPGPRAMEGIVPRRQPAVAKPLHPADLPARRR